ncbi:MAG: hypothetical protein KA777_01240 [Rhodoferax sp.]|nr:hypothetical protein [Rhodoferax sp.]
MTHKLKAAAHTLQQQLAAFVKMVESGEASDRQAWIDTVPNVSEAEAEERLATLRDKWHRPNGGK